MLDLRWRAITIKIFTMTKNSNIPSFPVALYQATQDAYQVTASAITSDTIDVVQNG
jgi:hypothetical protein